MALLPEIQKEHDKIVAEILLKEEVREKEWFESWATNNAEKIKEYKRKYRLKRGSKPRLTRPRTQQEIEERRKEKASGNLNKQKKEAEMAQAIAYLMTQTNSRDEAKQDIGAMAQRYPDSAAEILGLLDMFPEKQTTGISPEEWKLLGVDMGGSPESGASATTVKKVQLVDPRTRDIVEYDGVNDPDYFSDLQKGYMPL